MINTLKTRWQTYPYFIASLWDIVPLIKILLKKNIIILQMINYYYLCNVSSP